MVAPRGGMLNHLAKGVDKRSRINGCSSVRWILQRISIGEGLPRHSARIESRVLPSPLAVTRIHEALRQPNGGADTPQWFTLIRQIRRDGWARGLGRARTDFPQSSYAVKTRMS
jgi:hypothetical protein